MTTPHRRRRIGNPCLVALVSLAALLGLTSCALSRNPVAVNGLVEPSYVRPADAHGRPLPQSYVFVPGRHFPGMMKYSVLEKVKFPDLLPPLAEGLRQQNYILASDPNKADLLIVVHWGVVDVLGDTVPLQARYDEMNERLNELTASIQASIDSGGMAIGDAAPVNQTFSELRSDAFARDVNMKQVAGLLGYTFTLAQAAAKPFSTPEEESLRADLLDSRYLVVLAAYEREPANNGKRRRMWVTRLSLRAPGSNFVEALPALVAAGRQVFGQETDGIVRVQRGSAVPHVRLGELQVIETVSDEAAKRRIEDEAKRTEGVAN